MKTRKGEPVIVVPGQQQQIVEMERQLAAERERGEHYRNACIQTERNVQQTLGYALGYPWCKDDQKAFPGSTEADGVCVGEHTAETLAMEAAKRIGELEAELVNWKEKYFHEEDMGDDERKEHLETREKLKQVEVERDELKRKLDDCQCETRVLNESLLIEARQERANWQETARQAYRDGGYYRSLVVSIGELFGQEARTSDEGSIQDDVLCAKVPELCTTMRVERDQLAAECGLLLAECGLLRDALIWASAADDFSPGGEGGFLPGKAREGFEKIVLPALATTPQAAKFAERVRMLEDVVKTARYLTETRIDDWHWTERHRGLCDALDKLDAVDKPKEEEALK